MSDIFPTSAIGARVTSWSWDEDELRVDTDRGRVIGRPYGPCCSTSWFEDVDEDSNLTDSVLLRHEASEQSRCNDTDPHGGDQLLQGFGTIFTDRGRLSYELRNSSNGCYEGEVLWSWTPKEVK